jgi:hypothetical protein
LVFVEGGKPKNPEKNPRSKGENQQQTQLHMTPSPGIEPGSQWREASGHTATPPMLPMLVADLYFDNSIDLKSQVNPNFRPLDFSFELGSN